jgi:hypothetical protein
MLNSTGSKLLMLAFIRNGGFVGKSFLKEKFSWNLA